MIHAEARLTAEVLEDARQKLIERQAYALATLTKHAHAQGPLAEWIEKSNPLDQPVGEALWARGINPGSLENEELQKRVTASLKHRILTGRYVLPVYVDDPGDHPGSCGRIAHDEEMGMWRCELDSSTEQRAADSWHAVYGIGPACPYWRKPGHAASADYRLTPTDREVEELFGTNTAAQGKGELF